MARGIFDVRVFHHSAPSYRNNPIAGIYCQHETRKRLEDSSRGREVEHRCFTPLVFSTSGGIGREGTTFYKRLAAMLNDVRKEPYSVVLGWIRRRISFSLLRSAILCMRGSRHLRRNSEQDKTCISLAMAERDCASI